MNRVMNLLGAGALAVVLAGCDVDDTGPDLDTPSDTIEAPIYGEPAPVTNDGVRVDVDEDRPADRERVDVDVDLGGDAAVRTPADGDADTLPELRQQRRQERRERIGEALENVDVQVDDANVDVNVD